MEGGPSSSSSSNNEPLDVKPLRCFAPMFPAPMGFTTFVPSNAPPSFVCVAPFGPCPPGYVPIIPGAAATAPPEPQRPCEQTPHAVNRNAQVGEDYGLKSPTQFPGASFHTPKPYPASANGADQTGSVHMSSPKRTVDINTCTVYGSETEDSNGKAEKRKAHKRVKNSFEAVLPAPADGDRESVERILITYDTLRRRLVQLDDVKEPVPGTSRRPDLKAGTIMMNRGLRVNTKRRIGAVPGVKIGDLFFFRFEMCLIGLHAPSMGGIDYMNVKFDQEYDPVALSIVSSGMYEDDDNDANVLIYSGQGGSSKVGKQIDDQKLERGNLALEKSSRRKNEIRVIKGMKDVLNPPNKIYVYDGLYKIQESWIEKGKSGFSVFKYKLLRAPGQPDGSVIWKMTHQWKENPSSRSHMILPDISSGMENISVCLVNDVDKEKGPPHFSYATSVKYLKPISSMTPSVGCICHNVCMPGDSDCSCSQRNGDYLPYSSNGLLLHHRALIYECGTSCPCSLNCRNRVSQRGLRFHFEVFKTRDCGWGLRSWDPIRAGSFICEYVGEVIDKIKSHDEDDEDEYIFEAACTIETSFELDNVDELMGEEQPAASNEAPKPFPIVISAKNMGNISRFMNHSCSPNVFWQRVLYDHGDECYPHIMFYAMKHIPPMTELTYDYGRLCGKQSCREGMPSFKGGQKRKRCVCGSEKCRGYF